MIRDPSIATVAGRLPEVDPATRTRTVILRLDESAAEYVVHGQVVRLALEGKVEESGYWLPVTSLTKGTHGLWTLFVSELRNPAADGRRTGRRTSQY